MGTLIHSRAQRSVGKPGEGLTSLDTEAFLMGAGHTHMPVPSMGRRHKASRDFSNIRSSPGAGTTPISLQAHHCPHAPGNRTVHSSY